MSDGLEALRRELRADPPRGVAAAVDDAALGRLAELIREARHSQGQALADAGEHALGLLPRVLRGPVRRIAGG